MKWLIFLLVSSCVFFTQAFVYEFKARETLTPVELDVGDTVKFTLKNGETRTLTLDGTDVRLLENVPQQEGMVYTFAMHVKIDGHPMTLRRYAPTQESFYEPVVVNGLRIWPDMVLKVFDMIPMRYPHDGNLRQRPWKSARFALQDATLPICPGSLHKWYDNTQGIIPVGQCYHGGDVWMGPFGWGATHGGLDICHKRGDLLYAPFDVDDQWYFNSLKMKHDNNRWRGIRRWSDGALWAIQTHHLIDLKVDEHTPVKKGTAYATSAGTAVGWYDHTHFEFKIARDLNGKIPDFDQGVVVDDASGSHGNCKGQPEVFHLDPWILFWQIFRDEKAAAGKPMPEMLPVSSARTGETVSFAAVTNMPGARYAWSFGDGMMADGAEVKHAFMKSGIYPVTLTRVCDGKIECATQHITVDGDSVNRAAVSFACDDLAFLPPRVGVMEAYGRNIEIVPFELQLFGDNQKTNYRDCAEIKLLNRGGGKLPAVKVGEIVYRNVPMKKWLTAEIEGEAGSQILKLKVSADGIHRGNHRAEVMLLIPGSQEEKVVLPVYYNVNPMRAVDWKFGMEFNKSGAYLTPGFWMSHNLRGAFIRYCTNGARAEKGQFVRFTPKLIAKGKWKISIPRGTPSYPGEKFWVRVFCATGEHKVKVEPFKSLTIGDFDFDFNEGYVEILAENSEGLVAVRQLEFLPVHVTK